MKANCYGSPVKIKVIGLGGSGCNTVTRMVREQIRGVEFIAMNTDRQSLELTEAPVRQQLGRIITGGMGAGGNPELGRKAAEENRDEIAALLAGADMVFITCGMGGGTGTGSASVVADIAREAGALTIAVVGKPFSFEGRYRSEAAEQGLAALLDNVDSLVVVSNDRLLDLHDRSLGIDEAFLASDRLLKEGIQVIADLLNTPGIINLDFADVKAVLKNSSSALMSIGTGRGRNRSLEAAQAALKNPLMDFPVTGAKGILFNISGDDSLTLREVQEAAEFIGRIASREANIIFGVAHDPAVPPNEAKITLVATGFATENIYPAEQVKPLFAAKEPGQERQLSEPTLVTPQVTDQTFLNQSGQQHPQSAFSE